MEASKQFAPDVLLERPDVTTDRRLRHIQFASGFGEAEPPRRGLESAECQQGWWADGHRKGLIFQARTIRMSLSYPKLTDKSFARAGRRRLNARMNFYSASVALLWTTAMRVAAPPQAVREPDDIGADTLRAMATADCDRPLRHCCRRDQEQTPRNNWHGSAV